MEYERVEDERIIRDEEVESDDHVLVVEDEEVLEEDEEIVGFPVSDPVGAYIYGLTDVFPKSLGEWRFSDLVREFWKALHMKDFRRSKRLRNLIYAFCPLRPTSCPLFSNKTICKYGLVSVCKFFTREPKPRKIRKWFRGK